MSEQSAPPVIQKPPPAAKPVGPPPGAAATAAKGRKPVKEGRTLEILFRVGVATLLVGSLVVAYWSYFNVLVSRQKELRKLTTKVTDLSTAVDDLDRKWQPAKIADLTNRFANVPGALFSSSEAQQLWTSLENLKAPLGIDMKVSGKEMQPTKFENVFVYPISMELRPAPDFQPIESSFQRVLRFTQSLVFSKQRADITQFTVVGDSNSVASVAMKLDLWTEKGSTK